jgi:hypothetical protein
MSQTAIATKHTITAITGTSGGTWNVAGRDSKNVITWRRTGIPDVPSSDTLITISSATTDKGGWKATLIMNVPLMEQVDGGTSAGYAAQPKVAERSFYNLQVTRSSLLGQAGALSFLDEFAYAILTDAKLRNGLLGYTPADA